MRPLINFDHAFFARPIRRYVTVAICALWGLFELSTGAVLWAIIFLGLAGLAQWRFMQIDWTKYDGGS
ncbi:hypothetical protein [uncultured Tateyamaria sp.]|uniref:hypothetical protein n=1 Tax=uncultured Tateyamaria sp. TaxID=455651 RepID=UPI002621BA5C|nr:hypothetical protein [uncultured Tateyamaria sp.]